MKKLFFLTFSVLLCACAHQNIVKESIMTTDEVVKEVERLSDLYLVDAKLNKDYLNRHPVLNSDKERIKEMIIRASSIYQPSRTVTDSIGTFKSKPIETKEDKQRIKELGDSARWSRVCNICFIDGNQSLTDKYALNYYICFKDMDVNDMKVIKKEAYIVDKLTNDSTEIDLQDLKFAQISNGPLILAYVFSIDHDGHKYIIHQLYDVRSWSEKRGGMPNKTTGCYQVK